MFTKIGNKYIANQQKGINRMKKHPALIGFLITANTVLIAAECIILVNKLVEEFREERHENTDRLPEENNWEDEEEIDS